MDFKGPARHKVELAGQSVNYASRRKEMASSLGLEDILGSDASDLSEDALSDIDDVPAGVFDIEHHLTYHNAITQGCVEVSMTELNSLGKFIRAEVRRRMEAETALEVANSMARKQHQQIEDISQTAKSQVSIVKKSYEDKLARQEAIIEKLNAVIAEQEDEHMHLKDGGAQGILFAPRSSISTSDPGDSTPGSPSIGSPTRENDKLLKLQEDNSKLKQKLKTGLSVNKQLKSKLEEMIPSLERLGLLEEENARLKQEVQATIEIANQARKEASAANMTPPVAVRSVSEENTLALELKAKVDTIRLLESQLEDRVREGVEVKNAEIARLSDIINQKEEAHMQAIADLKAASQDRLDKLNEEMKTARRDYIMKLDQVKKNAAALVPTLKRTKREVKALSKVFVELARGGTEFSTAVDPVCSTLDPIVKIIQDCAHTASESNRKYKKELVHRRKLFNEVQELRGNIRVFCRCRPLSEIEISKGHSSAVSFENDDEIVVRNDALGNSKLFGFERVFGPMSTQTEVFAETEPLVTSVLDGYNVCIFAYGQTGSGKTFTMEGPEGDRGVNFRALELLFELSKEKEGIGYTTSVRVASLEIYNESLRDLLSDPASTKDKKLDIRQVGSSGVYVPGMVWIEVGSFQEVLDVMAFAGSNRAVGATSMNELSSRSHMIHSVEVACSSDEFGSSRGKLHLVDLAGSERVSKSEAAGSRLVEAQNINKSLSALGDVISSLAMKQSHVPYRNSKLTYLLQDSLGGDSKTLMFVNCSPSSDNVTETLSSLNFATRVRSVEKGKATKNEESGEVMRLRNELERYKRAS